MDQGTGRYAAFLSYSHKDAAAARWLHRRLESYRIPKRLVGKEGERGPVPARLTPIFRDREELPAAGDLSERVRAALAVSDSLVILCSPNAAGSPWVAKEIAAYRELHPDRPIYAAIVEGEPAHCFPPNLAAGGAEPLAADLRPHADGRRLGFLKLVAGLSGVGLDALVQRDAQRRIRSVTAVTAAALAAMLVMAMLTGLALSQRREAQRQRAEAEGLVEFMLTDLRDRLRTVGRLDVMQAVNARLLQRYGGRAELKKLSGDALSRRARILQAIGADELTLGNVDGALVAFQEAHRTTGEQLARGPDNLERQLDHAHSVFGIGRVYEIREDWPKAQRQYILFARATRHLARMEPSNPDYLKEAAWSAIDLGNIQLKGLHNPAAAQRSYESAVRLFEQLGRTRPGNEEAQRDLANAYAWLADSYLMQGMWRQSLDNRLKQYPIAIGLVRADPRNVENLFRYAVATRAISGAYRRLGNRRAAAPAAVRAYRLALNLTTHDPRNAEWLLFRALVDCDILFGGLGLPDRVTKDALKHDITSITATLVAEHNPRVSEFNKCASSI